MIERIAKPLAALAIALILCGLLADVSWAGDGIWTHTGPCLHNGCSIRTVEVTLSNSTNLYAAGGDQLYRSRDSGASWSVLDFPWPPGGYLGRLVVSYQDSERIYASSWDSYVLYRSDTGGQSWTKLRDFSFPPSLAIAPSNDDIVYAGGGNHGSAILYRTTDGGQSWTGPIGDWNGSLSSLTVDPNVPQIVYAVTNVGFYRSNDSGASFEDLGLSQVNSVGLCANDSELIYAGTELGLFISEDRGDSWLPAGNLGGPVVGPVVVDPFECNTVYVVVGSPQHFDFETNTPVGVHRSLDGGQSWTFLDGGMGQRWLFDVAVDTQSQQSIFVVAAHTGVWKYTFGPASRQDYGISINDGAIQADSTDVTLSLTARPGTTEMMISNDGSFNGASWEPFADQKNWTLEVYGGSAVPSTVYAKFMTSGKISGMYQDDILVVTGGTVGGATISTRGSVLLKPWVVVLGTFALGLGGAWIWSRRHTK